MKSEAREAAGGKFVTTLLVGVLIVMALPILNGGPAIYFDTPAYLEPAFKVGGLLFSPESAPGTSSSVAEQQAALASPEGEKIVTSGRSLYYGLFLYVGWESSFWLPVSIQATVLCWLIILLFQFASPQVWRYQVIATLFIISLFSSASFFVGLLMPDIWAGIMIVVVALLWTYGHRLSTWSKLAMLAILVFSVLAHSSHFVLLAAVTVLLVVLWMINPARHETLVQKLTIPGIALGLGVAGMVAYGLAVKVVYDAKLMHRPFLTAHLTDMGPGTRYLQNSCPESGFVLCDFKDKLPVAWDDFLFDRSPETGIFGSVPIEEQFLIAEEQMSFVLQTLAAEPLATVSGLIRDGITQLWTLSMAHVALTQRNETFILEHAQPALADEIADTRVYNNPDLMIPIDRNITILALLSALIFGAWLILRLTQRSPIGSENASTDDVITILIAGVVLNALICGMLASPYGRFQSRIVWILPLVASLILASKFVALEKPRWLLKLGRS